MIKILGFLMLAAVLAAFVVPGAGGYVAAGVVALCTFGLVLWALTRPHEPGRYQD